MEVKPEPETRLTTVQNGSGSGSVVTFGVKTPDRRVVVKAGKYELHGFRWTGVWRWDFVNGRTGSG